MAFHLSPSRYSVQITAKYITRLRKIIRKYLQPLLKCLSNGIDKQFIQVSGDLLWKCNPQVNVRDDKMTLLSKTEARKYVTAQIYTSSVWKMFHDAFFIDLLSLLSELLVKHSLGSCFLHCPAVIAISGGGLSICQYSLCWWNINLLLPSLLVDYHLSLLPVLLVYQSVTVAFVVGLSIWHCCLCWWTINLSLLPLLLGCQSAITACGIWESIGHCCLVVGLSICHCCLYWWTVT